MWEKILTTAAVFAGIGLEIYKICNEKNQNNEDDEKK